jgi:hypothetical protein
MTTAGAVDAKQQADRRTMIRDASEVRIPFAETYVKLAKKEAEAFVIEPDIRFDWSGEILFLESNR